MLKSEYTKDNTNPKKLTITKNNCLLVKKLLSKYIKKKILYKKPNDLLIDKKKISGILQEVISVSNKIFVPLGTYFEIRFISFINSSS